MSPLKAKGLLVEPGVLRLEVGDIPVYWSEGSGPAQAGLTFRVGGADETLATSGITGAVATAVFAASGANGSVELGPVLCTFRTTGAAPDVLSFLGAVAAAVPVARLDTAVAAGTTPEPRLSDVALGLRFGARRHGLVAHPAHGLGWLREPELAAWRDRWFTAGNAAAWVSAPTVAGLALALPAGERCPAPPHDALRPSVPSLVRRADVPTGLSVLHPSTRLWTVALALMEHRLSAGSIEDVDVDGRIAHAVVTGDPDEIASASSRPASAEELVAVKERVWPDVATSLDPARWCNGELLGGRVLPRSEQLAQLTALTSDDLNAAWTDALRSALWVLAPGAAVPSSVGDLAPLVEWAEIPEPSRGVRFEPVNVDIAHPAKHLVVSPRALYLVLDDHRCVTVGFAGATAVCGPDGTRDVWSTQGFHIDVHPVEWQDAGALVRAIDGAVASAVPAGSRH